MPRGRRPNEQRLFVTQNQNKFKPGEAVYHNRSRRNFIITWIEEFIEDGEKRYAVYGVPEEQYGGGSGAGGE